MNRNYRGLWAGAQAIFALVLLVTALVGQGGIAQADSRPAGAVFALTNAVAGNAVVAYDRASDGSLTQAGSFLTGGVGTGSGLGSQGALVLSANRRWLFAVNAGSNDISVFSVNRRGLRLVERVNSGGVRPISLTVYDDLLYVLNAGAPANITGFQVEDGHLSALSGSTQLLSQPNPGPAQVAFSPDGESLVVTEKATNLIDVFSVGDDSIAQPAQSSPSVGLTPFGFAFDRRGHLVVSNATGGAAGAGTTSSYELSKQGLRVISAALPSGQGAPCWVVITRTGRYAFIANTASGTISTYRIDHQGQLSLLQADGVAAVTGAGTAPADLALSHDGQYLYVRNGGTGTISAFAIGPNGSLSALTGVTGLPVGSAGLAAS